MALEQPVYRSGQGGHVARRCGEGVERRARKIDRHERLVVGFDRHTDGIFYFVYCIDANTGGEAAEYEKCNQKFVTNSHI